MDDAEDRGVVTGEGVAESTLDMDGLAVDKRANELAALRLKEHMVNHNNTMLL